ncbi:hypothetical protein NOX90_05770 [Wolbachia endosymbiont of Anurida maritima]|uniref:hypothetical protein n=1 Tax=Wolbachia endosymbiont of Anurida maritima TaxID=2850562 RepID=UPI0035D01D86
MKTCSYREKPKNGFMFTIDTRYEISKDINILCDIGYKSKGFIPGQYLDKTLIANLALEHRI